MFPFAGLLVQGRDPRRRQRERLQRRSSSSGVIGAVHDRRLHDPLHLPHLPRRAPRRRGPPPPARVALAHHRCRLSCWRCCRSSPASSRRRCSASSCSPTVVEPAYVTNVVTPSRLQRARLRCSGSLAGVIGIAASRRCYYFRNLGPRGVVERNAAARAGYSFLVNKYYLDAPLHRRRGRQHQGPDRTGDVLGQPEHHRRHAQRGRRAGHHRSGGSPTTSSISKVVDGAVNGIGVFRRGRRWGIAHDANRQGAAVRSDPLRSADRVRRRIVAIR